MPEQGENTEQQPAAGQEPTNETAPKNTPPWGDDFDPEKAWNLIQNLRGDKDASKQKIAELSGQLEAAKPVLEEADRLRRANQTDVQNATEQLEAANQRIEELTGGTNRWRDQAVAAKAEALAAAMQFADAAVGVKLLGSLSEYVGDDGIDTAKLSGALDGLLKEHPYLARSDDGQRRMKPNPAQGSSGAAPLTPNQSIKDAEGRGDRKSASRMKADLLLNNQQ